MSCSRHPWYYVPGRKDLTEKLLSQKREKDALREETWKSASNYFSKCNIQNAIHRKWQNDKSLIKYQKDKKVITDPPYDTEPRKTRPKSGRSKKEEKDVREEYNQAFRTMAKQLDGYYKLQHEFKQLQKTEQQITSQLIDLKEIDQLLSERQDFWKIKEKRLDYLRFGRDKLRQKAFLLFDQLDYYKSIVESIKNIHIGREFLPVCEAAQVAEVTENVIKIIDMFIQLNTQRNYEFQLLFE